MPRRFTTVFLNVFEGRISMGMTVRQKKTLIIQTMACGSHELAEVFTIKVCVYVEMGVYESSFVEQALAACK